jgi:hypothetical protein
VLACACSSLARRSPGRIQAGACQILADVGADVLKIEPPGVGDPLRTWSFVAEHGSLWALTQCRDKTKLSQAVLPRWQDGLAQLQ